MDKSLIPGDGIKSEFILYGWQTEDYEDSIIYKETYYFHHIEMIKKPIAYAMSQAFRTAKEIVEDSSKSLKKSIYYGCKDSYVNNFINKVIHFTQEDFIPAKFCPDIKDISHRAISSRKKSDYKRNIGNLRKKIESEKDAGKKEVLEQKYLRKINTFNKLRFFQISYKDAFISFLEQKELPEKNIDPDLVVRFFKELTKKDGIEFEKYVNHMTKKCMDFAVNRKWNNGGDIK